MGRFTSLIAELDPTRNPPPELLALLRKVLRKRMVSKGYWNSSPRKLGYDQGSSWRDAELFGDLVMDHYLECIVWRYEELKGLIDEGNDVDGCVRLNVNRKLTNDFRKHNPREYKIHMNCEAACLHLVEMGEADASPVATTPSKKIRMKAESVIRFANSGTITSTKEIAMTLRSDEEWSRRATAVVRGGRKAKRVILAGIRRLRDAGILAIRFDDFRDVVKSEYGLAESAALFGLWPEGFRQSDEQGTDPVGIVWDRLPIESLWSSTPIHQAIGDSGYTRKVKDGLHLVEATQHDAFDAARVPPGPTELKKMYGGSKTTWGDYVNRLQTIRRETIQIQ